MTGCNRFSRRAARLAAAALFFAAICPAAAQTEPAPVPEPLAPMQLTPPRPAEATPAAPGLETAPPPVLETGPTGIQTETLAAVAPDSVGLLDPTTGGLPLDLWRGLTRTDIFAALRDLPSGMRSPAQRALLRRLLLSAAVAPDATADDAAVPSLLATRITKLMSLGEIDAAADLAEAASGGGRDLGLARARIEALFVAGRLDKACAVQPVPTLQGYNARVSAVCTLNASAQGGDKAQGKMALQAARQTGGADAAFLALGDAVLGTARGPAAAFTPTPFHIALYQIANATPPADMLKLGDETWVAALPRFKALSASARANAAHNAAMKSLIGPAALGEIYAALKLKPEEATAALAAATPLDARGVIAHRSALAAATEPAKIAEAFEKLWPRLGDLAGTEAALFAQDLRLLSPETLPPMMTAKGALLFAAQGDEIEARRWMTAAESGGDPAALAAQWPVSVIAGMRAASFADLNGWIDAAAAAKPAAAERALAGIEALGEPVPNDTWRRLLANPPPPSPAPPASILRALESAAEAGRIGEVASLSLQTLGAVGPAESHPTALAAAVRSLKAAGLDREARALALEAALSAAR
jgi:hypothetical protein